MSIDHSVTVLPAPAEFDVYTAQRFRDAVTESIGMGYYELVVDLTATTYLDSTAMGALVGARKRCLAHGGWLRLACPSEKVGRHLRMCGLDRVFLIADSVEDAINYDNEGATTT